MPECLTCKKPIQVTTKHPSKQYCSVKCFAQTEAFKLGCAKRKTGTTKTCLYCKQEFYTIKSYGQRKYCSMACYKKDKAELFDANIFTAEDIAEFNNFDEFLVKARLYCPFKGCTWEGVHLGQHVSKEHNISARKFKELVGFNVTEGLRTLDLKEKAVGLGNTEFYLYSPKGQRGSGAVSKQTKEHRQKIGAIVRAQTNYECRCEQCSKIFIGNWAQQNRQKKGLVVCCSLKCRQTYVSNKRNKENSY